MEGNAIKILVVDDEPDILEFISYNLKKEGYQVSTAKDGMKAIEVAQTNPPDLIILDIMMPGLDGVEVCRKLRDIPLFKNTLIIFLTARSEDYSEIAGFDVGGDDYIAKPIRPRVLIARINALLKRKHREEVHEPVLTLGDLSIDMGKRTVDLKGQTIHLPKKEFELLCLLASKPGRIFTRDEIYLNIWGSTLQVGDRTLDVHIRKLREKIGEKYIKTSKGTGYGIDF
ncbi:MAG: response regulator transcription factor [Cyclobacteriaceae bacterium]|nr:response regulator transcription factor [Cyclobacteriaceae bacterium]